ncbi:M10 family metallopeptidase C-terminal domain-containing protein [Microvirga sp. WGZ8]|uniref:M10 family metallopeptidase C-terminal domain-containing protein n=1 Tax=Microvirga puerhi TaxID=2876078 RepID=A0ABS7VLF3_9HYPH|nr:M10 family metallopeptidase C-terminal domain-containing protein [Microvirga puerhi]
MYGTDGKDTWLGGTTGEFYHGGKGDDLINGRGGSDTLWGGEGRDTFQFSDRWSAYGDKVMDFRKGEDKLDFHLIDANLSRSGDQAFIWDGYKSASYNGSVQHMWAVKDTARDVTHIYFKIDGNVSYVDLAGTNHNLTASDFYL